MKFGFKQDAPIGRILPLFLLLLFPALAQAHVGPGANHGFGSGAAHPLTGIDHICAMLAVGLWAAQRGGRFLWLAPLTFVSLMTVGAVLGLGSTPLAVVEGGIVASLLIMGVMIAGAIRIPVAAGVALIGIFALFHGHAHGTEMPQNVSGLTYGIGFVASTIALHLLGIGLGIAARRAAIASWVRYAGGAIAACGLYLCFC
jgi:urease accessory protein